MNTKTLRCLLIVIFAGLYSVKSAVAQPPAPLSGNRGAPPPAGYRDRDSAVPVNQFPSGIGTLDSSGIPAQPSSRIASLPTASNNSGGNQPVALNGNSATDGVTGSISTHSFLSILREGGVVMIPILFCSFVLVVFLFERWLFLRRSRVIPKPFVRGVIEQLEQQQLDQEEALRLCEENGSPIAELFTAALRKWNRPAVEMEQAVVDAGAHITSQLRRYLRLFAAISNLTPLLGLLGTVLGMIDAFNSIAQADAMGRPELLASGIGAALLTTAGGLCVAIPAYAIYVYFLGRTDKLILEMDTLVANVVELTSAEALANIRSKARTRKTA